MSLISTKLTGTDQCETVSCNVIDLYYIQNETTPVIGGQSSWLPIAIHSKIAFSVFIHVCRRVAKTKATSEKYFYYELPQSTLSKCTVPLILLFMLSTKFVSEMKMNHLVTALAIINVKWITLKVL